MGDSYNVGICIINFRLNEQLKPILDLLRETENVVLASEVLDPSPQAVKMVHILFELNY